MITEPSPGQTILSGICKAAIRSCDVLNSCHFASPCENGNLNEVVVLSIALAFVVKLKIAKAKVTNNDFISRSLNDLFYSFDLSENS